LVAVDAFELDGQLGGRPGEGEDDVGGGPRRASAAVGQGGEQRLAAGDAVKAAAPPRDDLA
jgi:hypothetical protein